jgi:hypothetical protein
MTDKKVPSFNDIAKNFDPMMPQETYDAARNHYFDNFVAKTLQPGYSVSATKQHFMELTERPKLVNPALAKTGLAVVKAAREVAAPAALMGQNGKDFLKELDEKAQGLHEALARDGEHPQGAELAGTLVGSTVSFAMIDGAVGAISDIPKVGKLLDAVSKGSKALEFGRKISKGAVAFGTYEAMTDTKGNRGYAFAKGALQGAAFDGAFSLAGKVFKRAKVTEDKAMEEVAKVLEAEPSKPVRPTVDNVVAEHVKENAEQARMQAKPLEVTFDNSNPHIRVMGEDKEGRPWALKVEPNKEAKAVQEMQQRVQKGGRVLQIFRHENENAPWNRFANMMQSMDDSDEGVKILHTEFGQANEVAQKLLEQNRNVGVSVEVKNPSTLHISLDEKQARVREITRDLIKRDAAFASMKPGQRARVGQEYELAARRIAQLHDPSVPDSIKRVLVEQLDNPQFYKYMPDEFNPWLRHGNPESKLGGSNAEEEALRKQDINDIAEMSEPEGPNEIQQVMQAEMSRGGGSPLAKITEGKAPEAGMPPGFSVQKLGAATEGMEDPNYERAIRLIKEGKAVDSLDLVRELKVKAKRAEMLITRFRKDFPEDADKFLFSRKLDIPQSERFLLGNVKKVLSRPGKTAVKLGKMTGEDEAFVFTGTQKNTEHFLSHLGINMEGISTSPVMVYDAKASSNVIWHEGMHVQLANLAAGKNLWSEIPDKSFQTILDAGKKLKDRVYKGLPLSSAMEEFYVHAATAIRKGDRKMLAAVAQYDSGLSRTLEVVDETTRYLWNKLRTDHPDFQQFQILQNKFRDLLYRTGRERLTRWAEGAERAGFDMSYDHEADTMVLHEQGGEGRVYRFASGDSVPDFFEKHEGSAYAPSATLPFELRGLVHPFAELGSEPFTERGLPMAEIIPSEDHSRGVLAMSAMIRPTMDWAQTVDKYFSKIGHNLGFFDKMKAVDDSVRNGEVWLRNNYETASKFLKGGPDRMRNLFELVAVPEEHWPAMVKRFNADHSIMDDARKARTWIEKFRDDTGIQVYNYLRNELPRLRDNGFETKIAYGTRATSEKERSFFHNLIVDGRLKPQDNHLGRFINVMLGEGYKKKFVGAPLEPLKKMLTMTDRAGQSVLGTLRFPVENYIKYIEGIPDSSQQIMMKTIGDFQKKLGGAFKQVNKMLPAGMKLPEEFNYPGTALNRMMAMSYVAGLGLRPIIPIRDALQVLTNTLPILGPAKFARGFQLAMSKDGWKLAREAGALLGRHNLEDLYGDVFQELPPHSGGMLDKAQEIGNKLLAPSRWGHNAGRAIAYLGEYGDALKAIKAFRAGKMDLKELTETTSMWFFDKPLQARFMRDIIGYDQTMIKKLENQLKNVEIEIGKAPGTARESAFQKQREALQIQIRNARASVGVPPEQIAKKLALETVDHTLWAYRRGTQPMFLRTGIGRVFGQYGLWPLNYLEFIKRVATRYPDNKKMAMRAAALWATTNYAASSSLSAMGADVGKWFFFSPAGYGGSPHFQLAQDIMKAPEESTDGLEARKRILKYPLNFIPASLEIQAVIQQLEEGGDAFNADGSPTPNLIRILGMHPKKNIMQDMTLEDRMQYEAGFKGRKQ